MATDSTDLEPLNRSHYAAETVELALAVMAYNGGNAERTSRQLTEQGMEIAASTLKDWRTRFYPKRYAKACEDLAPALEAAVVTQARESVIYAGQVEQTLLERLNDEVEHLDRKELAGAIRNVSTSKAINVDKFLALTGRPNVIHGDKTGDALLKELRGLAPGLIVNGSIEEPADANVVEPPSLPAAQPSADAASA